MMNQVTQANASGSEQTASASEELTAQSAELRSGVDVLVKLVKGKSFADIQQKTSSKTSEPLKKSELSRSKPLELNIRKNYPVSISNGHGNGNGNGNGNGKGNGHNGNGHNGNNHDDDSFFDM